MSFASGLQPVDWSLVQLGQSPPLPIIPLSDTVLAPARCLSRLVIKKFVPYPSSFCSSCPLSRLSPQKPSPAASGLTTLSADSDPHGVSPSPVQGRVSAEVTGKGPRRSPITSQVSVLHPNHSLSPLPSLKRASSLGLFPIVWVRMWSLYLKPRLAATRPYSRKSCHQTQPSSSYSCNLEKGSPRNCQLQTQALHTFLVR